MILVFLETVPLTLILRNLRICLLKKRSLMHITLKIGTGTGISEKLSNTLLAMTLLSKNIQSVNRYYDSKDYS
jgi:hypothetical protein